MAVLPGVYTEQVTMKQFVRLLSADPSSTDSTVFTTSTGDALSDDHPRSVHGDRPAGTYATVIGDGLESFVGLEHRDRRLHDRQPAGGRPGHRLDQPDAVASSITNSDILSTRTTSSTPASASR